MQPRLRGTIEISIASVGFGFLGIFGKMAFGAGLSVGEFLSYRFTLAALILWIALLLFRPRWVILSKKQIFIAALLGVFGYALFSTLYFKAVEGLSVTLAALLLYTYPFWTTLFSHFFTHDKVTLKEASTLVVATLGLLLLLWGHIEIHDLGAMVCGLLAAISYAIYVLVSGKVQKQVRPITSALYVITFGAVALAIFHHPGFEKVITLTEIQASSILGIALVCTVMPLTLELAALQKLRSSEVALLMMIEPLTAAFLGALIYSERLEPRQLFGSLLVVGALIANNLAKRNRPPKQTPLHPA